MNSVLFSSKGQSAIEYLMTYGWMLLVVAIVGGAIFSMVNDQRIESVSGFTGSDFQVTDFGLTSQNHLEMVIRNTGSDEISIQEISVTSDANDANLTGNPVTIPVGNTETARVCGFESVDGSNNFDMEFRYDTAGLNNLKLGGELSSGIKPEFEEEPSLDWYTNLTNGDSGSIFEVTSNGEYVWGGGYTDGITQMDYENGTAYWFFDVSGPTFGVDSDSNSNLYIASRDSPRVQKVGESGDLIWNYTGHSDRVFGLAVDESQYVYSSGDDSTIQRITPSGNNDWTFNPDDAAQNPSFRGLAVNSEYLYAGNRGGSDTYLRKIDRETGDLIWKVSNSYKVSEVNVDTNGNIYVSAESNYLTKFNPEGEKIWEIENPSISNKAFVSEQDNIYTSGYRSNGFAKVYPCGTATTWNVSQSETPYGGDMTGIDGQEGEIFIGGDDVIMRWD